MSPTAAAGREKERGGGGYCWGRGGREWVVLGDGVQKCHAVAAELDQRFTIRIGLVVQEFLINCER